MRTHNKHNLRARAHEVLLGHPSGQPGIPSDSSSKNYPVTRKKAIDEYCRDCTYDRKAAGGWREQVAACPATNCLLWRVRPIQDIRSSPDWIKARDPDALPIDFRAMGQAEAVRAMRAAVAASAFYRPAEGGEGTPGHPPSTPLQAAGNVPQNTAKNGGCADG